MVGLVSARASGWYSMYELNRSALDAAAREFLSSEKITSVTQTEVNAYDRKILADFSSSDGRLEIIPAKRKKLEAVLRHLAKSFEPGQRYSEKQVNEILAIYKDTATLRRELVGYGLLLREGASTGAMKNWKYLMYKKIRSIDRIFYKGLSLFRETG